MTSALNVFDRKENEVNDLLAGAANIVDGDLYPLFVVEWKATYAGGNQPVYQGA